VQEQEKINLNRYEIIATSQQFMRDNPGMEVEEALASGMIDIGTAKVILYGQMIWEDVLNGVDTDAEDYDNSYYMEV
jgi:hypothetical protein